MKVKQATLESFTKHTAELGQMVTSLLIANGCDAKDAYELVENCMREVDEVRESLGLEKLIPDFVKDGGLSKKLPGEMEKANKVVGLLSKLIQHAQNQEEEHEGIGFKVPKRNKELVN